MGKRPPRKEAQSAMEYLMTYGWAILVIAIVLGALFALGAFNTLSYTPRAMPGACQVFRPYGAGTTDFVNLEGECTNQLPEYVFSSKGVGDYILVPYSNYASNPLDVKNNITITAWVYISGSPYHDVVDKEGQYGLKIDYNNQPHACSPSDNAGFCIEWDTGNDWNGVGYAIPGAGFGKWLFIAASMQYNPAAGSSSKYWFANGKQVGNTVVSGRLTYANSIVTIGALSAGSVGGYGDAEWFNGSIANVQIYDVALSQNDIAALYQEGLGDVPIRLINLVGWWPLDGNSNDYSGNGCNGAPTNVLYLSSCASSYPLP